MSTFVSMNYKRLQRNLIHLNSVDSTNNYAANLIKSEKVQSGTTILTKRQTDGRGQRGRVWQSGANLNLTASFIVYPRLEVEHIFYLNMIASLSIHRLLADFKIQSEIKWPNDVLVDRKKICGILIENQLQGHRIESSIIGVGLNVMQREFEEGLSATSIVLEAGFAAEIVDVELQLFAYLDFYLDRLMNGELDYLKQSYLSLLFGKDKQFKFTQEDKTFAATILGIDKSGRLLLQNEQLEIKAYQMGELKMILD